MVNQISCKVETAKHMNIGNGPDGDITVSLWDR